MISARSRLAVPASFGFEHPAEGFRELVDVPVRVDVTRRRDRGVPEQLLNRFQVAVRVAKSPDAAAFSGRFVVTGFVFPTARRQAMQAPRAAGNVCTVQGARICRVRRPWTRPSKALLIPIAVTPQFSGEATGS